MKKAIENTISLNSYLKTHSIDDKETKTGDTLLHTALADNAHPEIIENLIIKGASPYIKNKQGERVIESTAFKNWIQEVLETHKPDPSKKTYYVYLAGPEVFLPFSLIAGQFIKAQTLLFNRRHLKDSPYNIEGIFPFDSGYTPKNLDFQDGINIYKGDVDIMNRSQAVMANMVKFRGPGMDGGTAFEMGYMQAQGKVLVGYYDERPYFDNYKPNRPYTKKVEEEIGKITTKSVESLPLLHYDKNNLLVEPFEMPDNLMMVVPTLSDDGKLNIPNSSWKALFVVKEKLDQKIKKSKK